MKNEDTSPAQFARTAFDTSDAGVPVFDRRWKVADLKGCAHPRPLALGDVPAKDQCLGAAADAAEEGPNHDLVIGGPEQRFSPYLSAARRDAVSIGMAPGRSIVEMIPVEGHDVKVGWLATEDGVVSCSPSV